MKQCDYCGASNRVHKIKGTEIFQCRRCYLKNVRHEKKEASFCSACARACYVEYRSKKGEPLCQTCYLRSKQKCHVCGKLGTFYKGRCKDCYETDSKRLKRCKICGEMFSFRYDFREHCQKCVQNLKHKLNGKCATCGKDRKLIYVLDNGGKACLYCYKRFYMTHTPCEICGTVTFCFKNKYVSKSICIGCANRVRSEFKQKK